MTDDTLGNQNVTSLGSVEFQQAVALGESTGYCRDYVLRAHTASFGLLFTRPRVVARFYKTFTRLGKLN